MEDKEKIPSSSSASPSYRRNRGPASPRFSLDERRYHQGDIPGILRQFRKAKSAATFTLDGISYTIGKTTFRHFHAKPKTACFCTTCLYSFAPQWRRLQDFASVCVCGGGGLTLSRSIYIDLQQISPFLFHDCLWWEWYFPDPLFPNWIVLSEERRSEKIDRTQKQKQLSFVVEVWQTQVLGSWNLHRRT